jgi:hypothetical protein
VYNVHWWDCHNGTTLKAGFLGQFHDYKEAWEFARGVARKCVTHPKMKGRSFEHDGRIYLWNTVDRDLTVIEITDVFATRN